jgi:dienelactone hydrolase
MQTPINPPQEIRLPIGGLFINADVRLPRDAAGLIVFAHGSGSSRHSPRNRYVADAFAKDGFATLLADLLTSDEALADDVTGEYRFDIPRLGARVVGAIDWMATQPELGQLPVGVFGASTGAAAALIAAADRPDIVRAVVSRGGRPGLAGAAVARGQAPALFLIGSRDPGVIALNRQAAARMHSRVEVELIAGATHLFEEPGTLEQVAARASDWFSLLRRPQEAHDAGS